MTSIHSALNRLEQWIIHHLSDHDQLPSHLFHSIWTLLQRILLTITNKEDPTIMIKNQSAKDSIKNNKNKKQGGDLQEKEVYRLWLSVYRRLLWKSTAAAEGGQIQWQRIHFHVAHSLATVLDWIDDELRILVTSNSSSSSCMNHGGSHDWNDWASLNQERDTMNSVSCLMLMDCFGFIRDLCLWVHAVTTRTGGMGGVESTKGTATATKKTTVYNNNTEQEWNNGDPILNYLPGIASCLGRWFHATMPLLSSSSSSFILDKRRGDGVGRMEVMGEALETMRVVVVLVMEDGVNEGVVRAVERAKRVGMMGLGNKEGKGMGKEETRKEKGGWARFLREYEGKAMAETTTTTTTNSTATATPPPSSSSSSTAALPSPTTTKTTAKTSSSSPPSAPKNRLPPTLKRNPHWLQTTTANLTALFRTLQPLLQLPSSYLPCLKLKQTLMRVCMDILERCGRTVGGSACQVLLGYVLVLMRDLEEETENGDLLNEAFTRLPVGTTTQNRNTTGPILIKDRIRRCMRRVPGLHHLVRDQLNQEWSGFHVAMQGVDEEARTAVLQRVHSLVELVDVQLEMDERKGEGDDLEGDTIRSTSLWLSTSVEEHWESLIGGWRWLLEVDTAVVLERQGSTMGGWLASLPAPDVSSSSFPLSSLSSSLKKDGIDLAPRHYKHMQGSHLKTALIALLKRLGQSTAAPLLIDHLLHALCTPADLEVLKYLLMGCSPEDRTLVERVWQGLEGKRCFNAAALSSIHSYAVLNQHSSYSNISGISSNSVSCRSMQSKEDTMHQWVHQQLGLFELCQVILMHFRVDVRELKFDVSVWMMDHLSCPFVVVADAARSVLETLSTFLPTTTTTSSSELVSHPSPSPLHCILREESELLLNEIGLRLRYADMESLDLLLTTPRLLALALHINGPDVLFFVQDMVEDLVTWLSRLQYGREGMAVVTSAGLVQAVGGLVGVCRRLVEGMEPRMECSVPGKETGDRIGKAYMEGWEKLRVRTGLATPDQVASCPPVFREYALERLNWALLDQESEELEQSFKNTNIEEIGEYFKTCSKKDQDAPDSPPPDQDVSHARETSVSKPEQDPNHARRKVLMEITSQLLDTARHYLSANYAPIRMQVLRILREGIPVLRHQPDGFPEMISIWNSVFGDATNRMRDTNPVVVLEALDFLNEIIVQIDDFAKKHVTQLLPLLLTILRPDIPKADLKKRKTKEVAVNSVSVRGNKFSSRYKIQVMALQVLRTATMHGCLAAQESKQLATVCFQLTKEAEYLWDFIMEVLKALVDAGFSAQLWAELWQRTDLKTAADRHEYLETLPSHYKRLVLYMLQ